MTLASSVLGATTDAKHRWSLPDLLRDDTPSSYPGRRPEHIFSGDFAKLLGQDTLFILTSPTRWDRNDWMLAGTFGTATVGAAFFDHQIKVEAQENRGPDIDNFARNFQNLGSSYSWIILGGFEAWGELGGDSKARAVGMDGLAASFIASGIVTPTLKYSIGRVRPNKASGTFEFKPFSGNYSFPSGHTTQAFVLATVIASHYPEWWVQVLAYSSAGTVGYSRIQQNSHYASDVVAGAAIGWSVARAIVHRNGKAPEGATTMQLLPYNDGLHSGLAMSINF